MGDAVEDEELEAEDLEADDLEAEELENDEREVHYEDFDARIDHPRDLLVEVSEDYADDLEPDQLDYESEWEDELEELPADKSRSQTLGRGCLVAWFCRLHPVPNQMPGCERDCLWTRSDGEARPHCFGNYQGRGMLEPDNPLHARVVETCARCLQRSGCQVETAARRPDLSEL